MITAIHIYSKWPCYVATLKLLPTWKGKVLDFLQIAALSENDRIRIGASYLPDKTARTFAVWCARQVQHHLLNPKSVAAIDTAEKFANGEVSSDELKAAYAIALDIARHPVTLDRAAREAAWAAAEVACEVAGEAAYQTAVSAQGAVGWASARSIGSAACEATSKRQLQMLIQMLQER